MNRAILKLAIPNIIDNISVPLLGSVDTVLVGHMEAVYFFGSLPIGSMILKFIYIRMGFLSMGTSGLTAQALGRIKRLGSQFCFLEVPDRGVSLGLLLRLFQFPISMIGFCLMETSQDILHHIREFFTSESGLHSRPSAYSLSKAGS